MRIKFYLAFSVIATMFLLSGHALALDKQSELTQRICENLKIASEQVLDDTSDTTKYLSLIHI